MYPRRGDTTCEPGCGSAPAARSVATCCVSPALAARKSQCRPSSGAGLLVAHTCPNEGSLTAQVENCSDISLATQNYSINERSVNALPPTQYSEIQVRQSWRTPPACVCSCCPRTGTSLALIPRTGRCADRCVLTGVFAAYGGLVRDKSLTHADTAPSIDRS